MTPSTLIIAVNGIENHAAAPRGWTDEFVSEVNIRTPGNVKVEKFEYDVKAIDRWLYQRRNAAELARRIGFYASKGWRIVAVGHSNGGELIAKVLDLGLPLFSAHLIAPAAYEKDFEEPILNEMIRRIHIYGSKNDRALKGAGWLDKVLKSPLLKWTGLGYGQLGLRGEDFAAQFPKVVEDHSIDSYDHSTWFATPAHLKALVRDILANDAADLRLIESAETEVLSP